MKNPKQGVLICGAYGMDNAGDDAVLRSIRAALRQYDGKLPLWVMARKAKRTGERFDMKAVHPLNVPGWLTVMGRARLFVFGGGSLLQNATSRRSLWFYRTVLALAKKRGCAVMVYGGGMGPVRGEKERKRCARLLEESADVICVRDAGSERTLREWGVKKPVLVTADPAFRSEAAGGEREKALGFVLRDWEGFWYRVPCFAAAARYGWEKYGLMPTFFRFAPGDVRAAKSVMAALGDVPCRMAADPKLAERMTALVGMRLHGLIFALRGGASPVGVSYDPKVADFCEENGLPWQALEQVTEQSLCALIDRAMEADGETLTVTAEKLRRAERQNAAAVWELLGRA